VQISYVCVRTCVCGLFVSLLPTPGGLNNTQQQHQVCVRLRVCLSLCVRVYMFVCLHIHLCLFVSVCALSTPEAQQHTAATPGAFLCIFVPVNMYLIVGGPNIRRLRYPTALISKCSFIRDLYSHCPFSLALCACVCVYLCVCVCIFVCACPLNMKLYSLCPSSC
jgi:hypothetical protein